MANPPASHSLFYLTPPRKQECVCTTNDDGDHDYNDNDDDNHQNHHDLYDGDDHGDQE